MTGLVPEPPHASTRAHVHAVVAAARHALPAWSGDYAFRSACIARLAELLRAERQPLAELISRETGKVLWESRLEVDAMIGKCGISERAQLQRRENVTFAAGSITYRPHGVAAVIGPFNFPGHLPLGHIAPALLAGNAVVLKPSEKAPGVGSRLVALLHASGVPQEVVTAVHGGRDTAEALIDADIDAVLFTGSYHVGSQILARLAHRPGVLTALEMGGNNPLVAWNISPAGRRAAVLACLQSAFATTGQRCSCARRLIVLRNDSLPDEVARAASRLRVGTWDSDPQPFCGPLIDTAAADEVRRRLAALLAGNARLLTPTRPGLPSDRFVAPVVVDVSPMHTPPPDEEIFGPVLQVSRVDTFAEAIELANRTRYGLVAGLLTDQIDLWDQFRLSARAGVLTLNRPTTGASSELPFGGIGNSGNHRPSAYFAADYCSYPVAEMASRQLSLPETLPPGIDLS